MLQNVPTMAVYGKQRHLPTTRHFFGGGGRKSQLKKEEIYQILTPGIKTI
jgi:hypothetical protein